ncbi:MAG: tRNA (N6-threonylcarbamoyladenosine(37)-N6)-methyltransferase TrmO, partial [Oscillospiraceae bacterium]|nr:tRNA (N6-threonylcarbamoyladenosine(37)-N6)-methyltransferase TrmO [Oscillospiraceae bacterium]
MNPIGYICTDFKEKFGIPRQSGRVPSLSGRIVMLPEYARPEAFRGIAEFSHLWLIFDFSQSHRENWSPTVRPPRLGGNQRIGVFATRSPFRPNPIGLSCVKLQEVIFKESGVELLVSGVDLLDGTPILDIKPYLPYADSYPDAVGSYAQAFRDYHLEVDFPEEFLSQIPAEKRQALCACLAEDHRPAYQEDPERIYHMNFAGFEIHFRVIG